MTRSVAALTVLALLLAGALAPVQARQPDADEMAGPEGREAERIEAVIGAAESYLGLPYRLGREGPDIFDCSGLVFRVFADTGQVNRIGSRRMRAANYMRWFGGQERYVEDVSLAERGDLVIYDAGSHIGIYVGRGRVISALVSGVTLHRIDGITLDVSGILKVDWAGKGVDPLPLPEATTPPTPSSDAEAPAALIPPLPWLEPLPDEAPQAIAQPGIERVDMRTASSRTFDNGDGTYTTELYTAPIFWLPEGTNEWQPIDLRFAAAPDGDRLAVETSPVRVELAAADAEGGFIKVTSVDLAVSLGLLPGTAPRGAGATPVLGDDARFADYAGLLRGDVGMRVFPRADGVKTFLVLTEPPVRDELSFAVSADGLELALEDDGSISLRQPAPTDELAQQLPDGELDVEAAPPVLGRIAQPLVLDSSDVSGEGRGVRFNGATLSLAQDGDASVVTIKLEPRALERATYPVYIDLSLVAFPSAAMSAQHTFASSRYPTASFSGYQRPEAPAHPELWHGRLPGTGHYNEAFIRFAGLARTFGAATVDAAALRFYPYWQYDLDGPRPTWVSRVAQQWHPQALNWELRPAVDAELGEFETRAGQWSDIDVTGHVTDVLGGVLADYGFRLHADGGGRGSWKRIVGGSDAASETLAPRLVVTWSGLRPTALSRGELDGAATLSWSHPQVAPDVAAWQVQVSADDFATIAARRRARGRAVEGTTWAVPAGALQEGVEYAWRVRARYGEDARWSEWSQPENFVLGGGTLSTGRTLFTGGPPVPTEPGRQPVQ